MEELKNKWIGILKFARLAGVSYSQINLWRDRPAFKKYVKEDGMNSSRVLYSDDAIRILHNYLNRDFSEDLNELKKTECSPEFPETALYK